MKLLIVDDNKGIRRYLKKFFEKLGHEVVVAENGMEALSCFGARLFDLVITDLIMPEMNGIEFIQNIRLFKDERDFDVLIFTAHGDMQTAIEALRAGAADYLNKPIEMKVLAKIVDRIGENQAKRRERHTRRAGFLLPEQFSGTDSTVFSSKNMKRIADKALKFHRDRDLPIIILGETGTGKEVLARFIHYGGKSSEKPFIDINCANLTSTLFESELFGYESGSFTGARSGGRKGKIDLANGGTLFFDEIGEMHVEVQSKLLRFLQEKAYYRVGGLKNIFADVRVICATNIDINQSIKEGKFRKDLYYRLNVGRFDLLPLRERKEEIIPLAEMFLAEFCQKRSKRFLNLGIKAQEMLISYNWPGNVRELRNFMEMAVFNCEGPEVNCEHFIRDNLPNEALCQSSQTLNPPAQGQMLKMQKVIDQLIAEALKSNNGNKTEAARSLGMSRRTLYRHLDRINNNN